MREKFESAASPEDAEKKYEALSGREKFEVILKLFGTENARESFVEVCRKYAELRSATTGDVMGENYQPRAKRTYSPPRRAVLHNQIMDTLQRLSIQSKKLDPVSEKVLNEMASREVTGQIITEWVLANDSQEDEDEEARKSSHMSPTALYHSQGKEH